MSLPTSKQASGEAQEHADWSTGLFDCFSNFENCLITCWCPCITFGQVAEVIDKGSTTCCKSGSLYALLSCFGCGCLYSMFYRSKMREEYKLKGEPTFDCLLHCCCERLALCQEFRELQNRGFDMPIDWRGNVEEVKKLVNMAPKAPEVEKMNR